VSLLLPSGVEADGRATQIFASFVVLASGTALVLRRALKIKGLEYPRDYKLLNVGKQDFRGTG
jgi:hypothetical protein